MSSLRHSLLPLLTVNYCYILLGHRKLPWARRESPGRWIPKGELQGTTLPAVESFTSELWLPTIQMVNIQCLLQSSNSRSNHATPHPSLSQREKGVLSSHSSSSSEPVPSLPGLDQHHSPWKMGKEEEESSFLPGRFTKPFVLLDWLQTPHTYKEKFLLLLSMQLFSLDPLWLNLCQDFSNTQILQLVESYTLPCAHRRICQPADTIRFQSLYLPS